LFDWSGWDDAIAQLCRQRHNGRAFAAFADSMFRGRWQTIRTQHAPLTRLALPMSAGQENENDNMVSAREAIEHGCGATDQLLPLATVKQCRKLGVDAELVETRVILLVRNIVTCLRQGNTCTGERMFACPPPTLESCMRGTPHQQILKQLFQN